MNKSIIIPPEIAALIPYVQLEITRGNPEAFKDSLNRLAIALEKCPAIGATNDAKDHPAIFHYFCGSTDLYICEYDREESMFGYTILNGDLPNAEWGFTSLLDIRKIPQFNIDYHFPEQTIEAALYKAYPYFYKEPRSFNIKV